MTAKRAQPVRAFRRFSFVGLAGSGAIQ